MKIAPYKQGTNEWKEWRNKGVTATDMCVLMGVSPEKTAWELWAEKTGLMAPVDLSGNPYVKAGLANEDRLREKVESEINDVLLPVCGESEEHPGFIASFDGLPQNQHPRELKWPSKSVMQEVLLLRRQSNAYKRYYYQVMHQIMVAGPEVKFGYLVFGWDAPGGIETTEFLIERDEKVISDMRKAGKQFLKHLEQLIPPEKNTTKDVYRPEGWDSVIWSMVAAEAMITDKALKELKEKESALKAQKRDQLNRLEALMGGFRVGEHARVRVTRGSKAGRTNYKEAFADIASDDPNAETVLEKHKSPPTQDRRLSVIKAPRAVKKRKPKPSESNWIHSFSPQP